MKSQLVIADDTIERNLGVGLDVHLVTADAETSVKKIKKNSTCF